MAAIICFGIFIGMLIFLFTLIITKKSGKIFMAPIVTLYIGVVVIIIGSFKIGGFEGIGFGFLGAIIIAISLIGAVLMLFLFPKINELELKINRLDKCLVFLIPLLLFATIMWTIATNEGYWEIERGFIPASEYITDSYYELTTISEGKKQIYIQLGEGYTGKKLMIERVKTVGSTEVIVEIEDGGEEQLIPFISIGINKIVEPFVVKTIDGQIIESKIEVITK
ncbi:hypothetical protein SAMN04488134_102317 [Amphibacillus marinus]|uniref:YesK-like protein n=1 Tax=Amphibacillus marinus TaxID=872970 RepID=A0A1H8KKC8_9BACI|nr:hypothetical protein [Amphibacillus marinus]SEN93277.1 hypothetical protein SAMN04488134_102317 [Amphibacillus marinus]